MKVIIVGSGPSGLTLALLLAQSDIQVTLLEAAPVVDDQPRAAMYAASAIRVLRKAGVLDDVRRDGFLPKDTAFRKLSGEKIALLKDCATSHGEDALTVLPLSLLGKLLVNHCERQESIQLRWNAKVVDVGQDERKAWAVLESGELIEGDYLCGCDGANSQVRKSLFGNEFPGKTWDAQVVATNVYYPFEKFGFDDINFIVDPEHYCLIARITNDGLWRVSYGDDTRLGIEQLIKNQPEKYRKILPGRPEPREYKLVNVGPYRIHQRCAERFRVGKILLAADAAHLVNPFGGLGLTGGFIDIGGLAECLIGIEKGKAGDDILDKYDEIRRTIWHELLNPRSSANFLRVSATDPETAREKDDFLNTVSQLEQVDGASTLRKEFDEGAYDICHDFTQYYHGEKNGVKSNDI